MTQRKTLLAHDAGWEEGKHPRGQPENAGQFTAHVAGNKIYKSAPEAISAANTEHKKSGAILGVEKYDPQKHPTATPAGGKADKLKQVNQEQSNLSNAKEQLRQKSEKEHTLGTQYEKPADVHVGPNGEKQGYAHVGHKGFAKFIERDGTWKKASDPLDKVLSSGKRDPSGDFPDPRKPSAKGYSSEKNAALPSSMRLFEPDDKKQEAAPPEVNSSASKFDHDKKSPQLQEYEDLQKHANATHMHPADFKSKTEALQAKNKSAPPTPNWTALRQQGAKEPLESAELAKSRGTVTPPDDEVGAVKKAIHGAVKEGKAFSPNEAARQQVQARHALNANPNEAARQRVMQSNLELHKPGWERTFGQGGKNHGGETLEQYVASMHPKDFDYVGAEKAQKQQHQQNEAGKDEQPGMVTQSNSGAPAYKGRNLDDDPVGDRSMPAPDCAGGTGWPGRVV